MLGHIVDFLGRWILEPFVYQKIYCRWKDHRISQLEEMASECRKSFLPEDKSETDIIKWVWVLNRMHSPEALMETEKWEAQSRFFGSLSIILLLLPVVYSLFICYKIGQPPVLSLGLFEWILSALLYTLFIIFCCGYYASTLSKRIRTSYWYFIAFEKYKKREKDERS